MRHIFPYVIDTKIKIILYPSKSPTNNPSITLTKTPTTSPSKFPTKTPTNNPSKTPTKNPASAPTYNPTPAPTNNPTKTPSISPTNNPIHSPSKYPSKSATNNPSDSPSKNPSDSLTKSPSNKQYKLEMIVELIVLISSLGLLFIILGGGVLFYNMYLYPKQNIRIEQKQTEQQIDNNIPSQKQDNSLNNGIEKPLPPTPQLNVEKSLPPSPQVSVISLSMKSMENKDESETECEGMYGMVIDNRMETNGRNEKGIYGMVIDTNGRNEKGMNYNVMNDKHKRLTTLSINIEGRENSDDHMDSVQNKTVTALNNNNAINAAINIVSTEPPKPLIDENSGENNESDLEFDV